MKTIEILISETGASNTRERKSLFNTERITVREAGEIKKILTDRYGKMPGMKNKVYVDRDGKSVPVGFLHSFWNRDISHNSAPWHQTDWITFQTVDTSDFNLKSIN